MANTPNDLIGKHPVEPDVFGQWLTCEDFEIPKDRPHNCHRALKPKEGDTSTYPEIADIVLTCFVSDDIKTVLKKKEAILSKYQFKRYVDAQKLLPTNPTMQKGNMAEILMTEYLKHSSGYNPFVFRFRYNWNSNQSMKGDDILLFNVSDPKQGVIFGESKYRGQASTKVFNDIISKIDTGDDAPLSISAVANVLLESDNPDKKAIGEQLMDMQYGIFEGVVPLTCVGFFMSSSSVHKLVSKQLNFNHNNRVMVTLGIKKPGDFVATIMKQVKNKLYGNDAAV